jgi:hypothetical protein
VLPCPGLYALSIRSLYLRVANLSALPAWHAEGDPVCAGLLLLLGVGVAGQADGEFGLACRGCWVGCWLVGVVALGLNRCGGLDRAHICRRCQRPADRVCDGVDPLRNSKLMLSHFAAQHHPSRSSSITRMPDLGRSAGWVNRLIGRVRERREVVTAKRSRDL